MATRSYWVYILTNQRHTTLYIGVTGDITDRMHRHRAGQGSAFAKRYNLRKLVHVETFSEVRDALTREKQLKNWHRDWKWNLIRQHNPDLTDLAAEI